MANRPRISMRAEHPDDKIGLFKKKSIIPRTDSTEAFSLLAHKCLQCLRNGDPRRALQNRTPMGTSKPHTRVSDLRSTWLCSGGALPRPGRNAGLVQPVALAAHLDEVAVVHEAVEKRRDGRCVTEKFRPVFKWAV